MFAFWSMYYFVHVLSLCDLITQKQVIVMSKQIFMKYISRIPGVVVSTKICFNCLVPYYWPFVCKCIYEFNMNRGFMCFFFLFCLFINFYDRMTHPYGKLACTSVIDQYEVCCKFNFFLFPVFSYLKLKEFLYWTFYDIWRYVVWLF